jgi:quercetin dioxygenase-like cupin family protein
MERSEFESALARGGYAPGLERQMAPNTVKPEHAHEFDARLLMLDGEMTITCDGSARTYRAGDTFEMAAGRRHAESCGAAGARYLAGLRHPPRAAD